jgi:type II secretory pathway pseudopilin PulG
VSRSTDMPRRRRTDEGFSLLEVVVAIGVVVTVLVALLPQLIVGMKSTNTARQVTQAKGIAQGELERMRSLPFHIARDAGEFIDVLDYYFANVTPGGTPTCTTGGQFTEPQTGWSGYVSAAATRCSYEPAGAFYRSVRPTVAAPGLGRFVVVTDAQFLSSTLPPQPVTPPVGYTNGTTGKDVPPATQIGVTLTVFRADHATLRPVTTYTQIERRESAPVRLDGKAIVKAVEVGSVTSSAGPLSFTAGLLDLTGTLSTANEVTASQAATSAGLSSGVQDSGASATTLAPPAVNSLATTKPAGALSVGGCEYACWGATQVGPVYATAQNGLPQAGSPTAPLATMVTDAANFGFSVGNSNLSKYMPGLALIPPLVRLDTIAAPVPSGLSGCAPGAGGQTSYVTASGYLNTTAPNDATAPSTVDSCAVARTTPVSLFPTVFAPRGVVRITLTRASARCRVQGSAHAASASYDYQAVVEYWNGLGYVQAATVVPGATTDPLAAVPLTTPVGVGHVLGDYIAAWSSLTAGQVTSKQGSGAAEVGLPGIVTIATQPVRQDAADPTVADPTSGVSLTVGALSCSAEDAR